MAANAVGAGAGRVTERVQRLLGNSESRRAKLPLVLASIAGLVLIAVYAC